MVTFDLQKQRKTRGFEKTTLVKHDVFSVLNVNTSRNSTLQASNLEEFDVPGLTLEVSSFFHATAATESYALSLRDALPISPLTELEPNFGPNFRIGFEQTAREW